ncbi:unnamed protein product [Symbiodinium microadriaticum]|nr:unnamed protein product [Symbiodinium microadriaticum]
MWEVGCKINPVRSIFGARVRQRQQPGSRSSFAMTRLILALVVACAVAEPQRDEPSLRGADDLIARMSSSSGDLPECTGAGDFPSAAPLCYGGQLLVETFAIKVVSYDGASGVDMEMNGPQTGQCSGAAFHNNDNVITIADEQECGLSGSEYTVRYCPDQDHFIINLVKPWNVDVVLTSQACPSSLKQDGNSEPEKQAILP